MSFLFGQKYHAHVDALPAQDRGNGSGSGDKQGMFTSKNRQTSATDSESNSSVNSCIWLDDVSDEELLVLAEKAYDDEKILESARLIRKVRNQSMVDEKHENILKLAEECMEAIADLLGEPGDENSGWTKQGESHGERDTAIYYKLQDGVQTLTCRVETPIEASLLIPLLSVMNESGLYKTWAPSWRVPKIGVRSSQQLKQTSRVNQLLQLVADVPWPFSGREVLVQTVAVDEIDISNYIAVILRSIDDAIPPLNQDLKRLHFKGTLLFRACPPDHPLLVQPKSEMKGEEPMVLVSFKMFCDPNMAGVPSSLINFVTRTVVGRVWGMLLHVAEQVRDGQRPLHKEAIATKAETYSHIQERVDSMLDKMIQEDSINADHIHLISYLQS